MIAYANSIQMLACYNYWANQLIFEAVAKLPLAITEQQTPPYFGSMLQVLNHSYIVNSLWQAHLQAQEHGITQLNPKTHPPLAELYRAQHDLDQWNIDYCHGLSAEQLREIVEFKLIGGSYGVMSREMILLHIVNHTTYHRGFIAEMFYKAGFTPPTTDLPVFTRLSNLL